MFPLSTANKKKFKKYLKNRNFVFCVTLYPVAFILYLVLFGYSQSNDFKEHALIYAITSFLVLGIVAIITIFETIEKRASHKVQGDKLKIKQSDSSWKS